MSVKTRVVKLEEAADSKRPSVASAFIDSPDGAPLRVFNSHGKEIPAGAGWEKQTPAAKVSSASTMTMFEVVPCDALKAGLKS